MTKKVISLGIVIILLCGFRTPCFAAKIEDRNEKAAVLTFTKEELDCIKEENTYIVYLSSYQAALKDICEELSEKTGLLFQIGTVFNQPENPGEFDATVEILEKEQKDGNGMRASGGLTDAVSQEEYLLYYKQGENFVALDDTKYFDIAFLFYGEKKEILASIVDKGMLLIKPQVTTENNWNMFLTILLTAYVTVSLIVMASVYAVTVREQKKRDREMMIKGEQDDSI